MWTIEPKLFKLWMVNFSRSTLATSRSYWLATLVGTLWKLTQIIIRCGTCPPGHTSHSHPPMPSHTLHPCTLVTEWVVTTKYLVSGPCPTQTPVQLPNISRKDSYSRAQEAAAAAAPCHQDTLPPVLVQYHHHHYQARQCHRRQQRVKLW